ncbi:hypothetical protein H5410_051277 [Solanum commersonii]|uniref:Uncharacterized protein n=1 Tax=Solanum commersonii TaxID=4109 RepID=A0A9J5WXZ6_SOLCO|nr:hypothetical protein H5410_051277 [Solanum commersonii]
MKITGDYERQSIQKVNKDKNFFYVFHKKVRNIIKEIYRRLYMFLPIYLLPFITPPKCEIYDLHRSFARFLWNLKEDERSKHCVSWSGFCLAKDEEGLGLRSLFDVFKVLFAKLE